MSDFFESAQLLLAIEHDLVEIVAIALTGDVVNPPTLILIGIFMHLQRNVAAIQQVLCSSTFTEVAGTPS